MKKIMNILLRVSASWRIPALGFFLWIYTGLLSAYTLIPLDGSAWSSKDNVRRDWVDDPAKGRVMAVTADFSKITYAWMQCKLPMGSLAREDANGIRLVWKSFRDRKQNLTLQWMENGIQVRVAVAAPVGPEWKELFIPFTAFERALCPLSPDDLGKVDTLFMGVDAALEPGTPSLYIASMALDRGPAANDIFPARVPVGEEHRRDLPTIKKRFIELTIPELAIPTNEAPQAFAHLNAMAADGSWSDIPYADRTRLNWVPVRHLQRLESMAIAWARLKTYGFDADKLAVLRGGVERGLRLWAEKDPQCEGHWWQNMIGNQLAISRIALSLEPTLSPEERGICDRMLIRSEPGGMTGGNLTWTATLQLVRALLSHDADLAARAYSLMVEDIRIAPANEEGLKIDCSFHQHGQQLYSGGYGAGWVDDGSKLYYYAAGTAFQISAERQAILVDAVLDGYRWMLWKGLFDYSVRGREVNRGGWRITRTVNKLAATAQRLTESPGPRQKELLALHAELTNIQNSIAGNRHFWKSDYMVHRRTNWMVSEKMLSTRMTGAELVNGEGQRAHNLSVGLTYLYQGESLGYENIFPVWDWKRLPGITVPWSPEPPTGNIFARGESDLAGGVSDGNIGATAYHFRREGAEARKSWFFFDGEAIALGAGITGGEDPMQTTLDQSLWTGALRIGIGDDERVIEGHVDLDNAPRWIHHRGFGFVPLTDGRMGVEAQERKGRWKDISSSSSANTVSERVVTIWIDHGANVKDGRYGYALVPGDAAAARSWSEKKPVTVLAHTAAVAAVEREADGILMAAFYEAGTVRSRRGLSLSVEGPAAVIIRQSETRIQLSVAHPSSKDGVMNITLSGKFTGKGASYDPARDISRIQVPLPSGDLAGSSVNIDLAR